MFTNSPCNFNSKVYWLGPISGGIVGAITYQLAFQAKNFKEDYSPTSNELGMK